MDPLQVLNRLVVPRQGANALRWTGQRGRYEAYYVTLNHRAERLGLWLRYTLDAPTDARPAFCELWGHLFDAASPESSFGLKQRFPIDQLTGLAGGGVRVGLAELRDGLAAGRLESGGRSLAWELSFDPGRSAVHLAPLPVRLLELASTSVLFANSDVRFTGAVIVDGRRIPFDREPGGQTHLWGRKHAERWAWGHCNAFDGRDDCVVEGVCATTRRLGSRPTTGMWIRYRGTDFFLNALPGLLLNRSEVELPTWRFEGRAGGLDFSGTFEASPGRLLQVGYEDPDGERSWCANSEIADLELSIRRGGRLIDRLAATGTAHVEFGDRRPHDEVRATVT